MDKVIALNKTYKNSSVSLDYSHLHCDLCNSEDVIEDRGSFICRDCGIVLEIQKLQYDRPYNNDIIQHASGLGSTRLGTNKERNCSIHSFKLHRLSKRNSEKNNYRTVIIRASKELSNLRNNLRLSRSLHEDVLNKFKMIYNEFRPRTKFRNPEKLVTFILYYYLKFRGISRSEQDILDNSRLKKREINNFKLHVLKYLPKYEQDIKQRLILQRINHIRENFDLDMTFYHFSAKIMHKLWNIIKNTKDDVITGLCSSIVALCRPSQYDVNLNSICKLLGIRMSTIQSQVKRKIIEQFKIKGFKTLGRSSDILRNVMTKLEIFRQKDISPEIIEIKLGKTMQVFNNDQNIDFYMFALKDQQDSVYLINLNVYKLYQTFQSIEKYDEKMDPIFDITFWKYFHSKGPPLEKTIFRKFQ